MKQVQHASKLLQATTPETKECNPAPYRASRKRLCKNCSGRATGTVVRFGHVKSGQRSTTDICALDNHARCMPSLGLNMGIFWFSQRKQQRTLALVQALIVKTTLCQVLPPKCDAGFTAGTKDQSLWGAQNIGGSRARYQYKTVKA